MYDAAGLLLLLEGSTELPEGLTLLLLLLLLLPAFSNGLPGGRGFDGPAGGEGLGSDGGGR